MYTSRLGSCAWVRGGVMVPSVQRLTTHHKQWVWPPRSHANKSPPRTAVHDLLLAVAKPCATANAPRLQVKTRPLETTCFKTDRHVTSQASTHAAPCRLAALRRGGRPRGRDKMLRLGPVHSTPHHTIRAQAQRQDRPRQSAIKDSNIGDNRHLIICRQVGNCA